MTYTKKYYKKKPSTYKKPYNRTPYKKPYKRPTYNPITKTNDVHFDEKIAKTDMILNSISKGFDVAGKPIMGAIKLAETYIGKFANFLFPKKK